MSRRQTFEIPGVTHGTAPIPMAAKVGPNFQSSAIMGKDPATDSLPDGGDDQVRFVFQNAKFGLVRCRARFAGVKRNG